MRRIIIPAIFALSGAAGLIFEVVWARQLVLVFGNTTQAVSAILTGFFGGMAIGSWFGGRIADKARRPLVLYGVLELVLALIVVLTPFSFRLIHEVYRSAYGSLEHTPTLLALLRFVLSMVALAPATILMGATLPTLTRYLARNASALGAAFTRLYQANTMGAVFGATAAGIFLIELFGLSGTLLIGASCSAAAGVIAITLHLATARKPELPESSPSVSSSANSGAVAAPLRNLALVFAFVSGLTSLSYQVLWTRLIASGTGSSTYVFTTILAVFLIGLAMGATEYKRTRAKLTNVVGALALTQVGIAALACIGMFAINVLDSTRGDYLLKTLVAVLPPTFLMGFSFPAASALVGGNDSEVATQSGRLLAVNTLGSIVGAFIVPFFLIPLLGSPRVLALMAAINAVTGALLARRGGLMSSRRRRALGTAGFAMVALVIAAITGGKLFVDPGVARLDRPGASLTKTAEDEIASVQAGSADGMKQLWVTGFSMTGLTVDAKLMPVLSLMLRPQSKSLLAIAFGMGSSFRSSLIAGLQTDAVELVPSVPKMFGVYYSDADVWQSDPRGRIIIADGRSFVELSANKYDIIIVDPPPPLQSSGVSIISSREFYAASKRRLNAGGVMMQWVPWGQRSADVKDHIRTFRSVFPNVLVARGPGGHGFYMFGSSRPILFEPNAMADIISRPGVLSDISSASDSPTHDAAHWLALVPKLVLLQRDSVAAFAGTGPMVTDDHPLPEYFLLGMALGNKRAIEEPHAGMTSGK